MSTGPQFEPSTPPYVISPAIGVPMLSETLYSQNVAMGCEMRPCLNAVTIGDSTPLGFAADGPRPKVNG